MDSDDQPFQDPDAGLSASSEGDLDNPGGPSAAAPEDDEASGAAPTQEPTANDGHGYDDDLVGDWAVPDIDLDHLTPVSDGEPDDDTVARDAGTGRFVTEEYAEDHPDTTVIETVDRDATGQALIEDGRRLASERDDLIAAGVDPQDLATPVHPDDVEAGQ